MKSNRKRNETIGETFSISRVYYMFEFISKYYVQVLTFVHGRIKKKNLKNLKKRVSSRTIFTSSSIFFLKKRIKESERSSERSSEHFWNLSTHSDFIDGESCLARKRTFLPFTDSSSSYTYTAMKQ